MKILENKKKEIKNKEIYLEILRIIACFFVIVSHTNNFAFESLKNYNFTWFVIIFYYILSRIAVPIFFMISGALYLSKEYSYKEMIKRSFFRLILPLSLFSLLIYFKRNPILSIDNLWIFIKSILEGNILGNYWFLYVLIGLYLGTPFIQKMCKNFNKEDYKVLIIFNIIFINIVSILRHYNILNLSSNFSIPIVSTYLIYYIIGNYIINYEINLSKKQEKLFLVSSIFILLIGVVMTYIEQRYLGNKEFYYGSFNSISIFILSIFVVYFIKKYFKKRDFSNKTIRFIIIISKSTFGVYLIHGLVLGHTKFIYDYLINILGINAFISILIYQICLFLGLSIFVYILRKIPFVNKIL